MRVECMRVLPCACAVALRQYVGCPATLPRAECANVLSFLFFCDEPPEWTFTCSACGEKIDYYAFGQEKSNAKYVSDHREGRERARG